MATFNGFVQNRTESKWSGLWLILAAWLRGEESYGFLSSCTENDKAPNDDEKCPCELEVMSCRMQQAAEGAGAKKPLQGEQMSSSCLQIDAAVFLTKMPKVLESLIGDL